VVTPKGFLHLLMGGVCRILGHFRDFGPPYHWASRQSYCYLEIAITPFLLHKGNVKVFEEMVATNGGKWHVRSSDKRTLRRGWSQGVGSTDKPPCRYRVPGAESLQPASESIRTTAHSR
jgi:hypothetical protein